jgi:hypothetical protein
MSETTITVQDWLELQSLWSRDSIYYPSMRPYPGLRFIWPMDKTIWAVDNDFLLHTVESNTILDLVVTCATDRPRIGTVGLGDICIRYEHVTVDAWLNADQTYRVYVHTPSAPFTADQLSSVLRQMTQAWFWAQGLDGLLKRMCAANASRLALGLSALYE